jgi:inner membrane protein
MDFIENISDLGAHWLWLTFAAILAISEVAIAPGVFLFFIAIAASFTGFVTMAIEVNLPIQLLIFAITSIISVYVGRIWYKNQNHTSTDPQLNDRAARMVGQIVTVVDPVSDAGGRVRVGDGEWPARGVALESGEKARIASVVNGIVHVEKAD